VYFGLFDAIGDLPASSPPIKMIHSSLNENGPVFVLTNGYVQTFLSKFAHKLMPKIADLIIESEQCIVINDNFQVVTKLCPVYLLH